MNEFFWIKTLSSFFKLNLVLARLDKSWLLLSILDEFLVGCAHVFVFLMVHSVLISHYVTYVNLMEALFNKS